MNRCLYCYEMLTNEEYTSQEFHQKCSKKFFENKVPPKIEYTQDDMLELAVKIIKSQQAVTGVQPKLSLTSKKLSDDSNLEKLTIVGLWGQYILKPQTEFYSALPEIEDVTMHLAESSKITTVPHSLIRLKSGELAYITKRVDRLKDIKLHMEDMCQLTERQTEHKYKGSHEQIAKAINTYSSNPGFDKVNFYETVLFCYLTGNNDMHLKNFSLLKNNKKEYNLSPAYDLVAAALVIEGDDEELALTLNRKKKKLKRKDFEIAMTTSKINPKAAENIIAKFEFASAKWFEIIEKSFLSNEMKQSYIDLIERNLKNIYK